MTPPSREKTIERVVVAIDALSALPGALSAGVQLAEALEAELAAVLLENADLVRAAALPFLRETGAVSGTAHPMGEEAMQRALRVHAEQVRAAVAEAAAASELAWHFEVVRDRRLPALCASLSTVELLVVGHVPPLAAPAAWRGAEQAGPVAVVLRDAPGAGRALRAARALADVFNAPLLALICTETRERAHELRALARAASHSEPRYVVLPDCTGAAILTAVRTHRARLLVWCAPDSRRNTHELEALLGGLRCPLVVAD